MKKALTIFVTGFLFLCMVLGPLALLFGVSLIPVYGPWIVGILLFIVFCFMFGCILWEENTRD